MFILHRLTYIEEMYGNNYQIQKSGEDYMAKVYVKTIYLKTFISTMQEKETSDTREYWRNNLAPEYFR